MVRDLSYSGQLLNLLLVVSHQADLMFILSEERVKSSRCKSYYYLTKEWLFNFFFEFVMDFTEDGEPEIDEGEGDQLTVKK